MIAARRSVFQHNGHADKSTTTFVFGYPCAMRVRRWLWFWVAFPLLCLAMQPLAKAQAPEQPGGEDNLIYAQRHFERGRDAFKDADYAKALEAFSTSLRLYASPNTRLYLARTLAKLERFTEAADTFEEVIRAARLKEAEEPSYAAARAAAERELTDLQNRLARVTVAFGDSTADVDALFVNERAIPRQAFGLPVYVRPGTVAVRVVYKDGQEQRQNVSLAARERKTLTLAPREPRREPAVDDATENSNKLLPPANTLSDDDGGSGAAAVGLGVGAGVAAVGWGGALLFGVLADNRFDELSMECEGPCPASRNAEIDEGETFQTLANVGLVVGTVGTVAAGVALVLLLSDDAEVNSTNGGLSLGPGSVRVRW